MARFLNGSLMSLTEEAMNLRERLCNTKAYLAQHGIQSDNKALYGQMEEWVEKTEERMRWMRKEFGDLFHQIQSVDPNGPFIKSSDCKELNRLFGGCEKGTGDETESRNGMRS